MSKFKIGDLIMKDPNITVDSCRNISCVDGVIYKVIDANYLTFIVHHVPDSVPNCEDLRDSGEQEDPWHGDEYEYVLVTDYRLKGKHNSFKLQVDISA